MSLPSGADNNNEGVSQAAFDAVTRNLLDIGCISMQEYLYGNQKQPPVTNYPAVEPEPSLSSVPAMLPSTSVKSTETVNVNAVTRLHQACQRIFGNTEALKFEFFEENGPRSKQCILTITRPDRTERSYTTQPTFARKNEAKAEAAKIAIEMGALDFLMYGERNTSRIKRGLILTSIAETLPEDSAPLTTTTKTQDHGPSPVDEIESCCAQWHAGRVVPHWVAFIEPKLGHKQGCALRVQLSLHVVRIYSSEPTFDKYREAKLACAQAAISEGVLDFIKYGNGQTRPTSPEPFASTSTHCTGPIIDTRVPLTLQSFYDSLPRPFPEQFDTDNAHEIDAPGWLNTIFQNARGGKVAMSFFFTSDNIPGLHGCLLKLDRPGDYRAYLVDARFTKRADAKAAVCLQAMSQGVGDYIRDITSIVGAQVTPAMRTFTNFIYPMMMVELSKIDAGLHPRFEFMKERDAFGASLIVELPTSPTVREVRRYTVPCDYRNKADAKAATICQAAEQGVIEFIRFRGGQLPLGYISPYTLRSYDPDGPPERKLEDGEESEQGRVSKKRKKGKKGEVPSMHGEGGQADRSQKNSSCQTHGVSESGGIGPSIAIGGHSSDSSWPVFGIKGGSGAAYYAAHSQYVWSSTSVAHSMHVPPYVTPFPVPPHPHFGHGDQSIPAKYAGPGAYQVPFVYPASNLQPSPSLAHYSTSSGPSGVMQSASSHPVAKPATLMHLSSDDAEPGEVLSSRESSENLMLPVGQMEMQGIHSSESLSTEKGKGKAKATSPRNNSSIGQESHSYRLTDYCVRHGLGAPSFHEEQSGHVYKVWIIIGKERFELPTTYLTTEEGRERVSKQVLARLRAHKTAAN